MALFLASAISLLTGVFWSLFSDSLARSCSSISLPYPLAYGVGIVERDARTTRQGDSSSGVARRSHHTSLYAPMMPGSGIDFLNWPVTHRLLVILALYGDTLATTVHDNVDALIPCSPSTTA